MNWNDYNRQQQAVKPRSWRITIWFGVIGLVLAATAVVSIIVFNTQGEMQYLIGAISSGLFALLSVMIAIRGRERNWREVLSSIIFFWNP